MTEDGRDFSTRVKEKGQQGPLAVDQLFVDELGKETFNNPLTGKI